MISARTAGRIESRELNDDLVGPAPGERHRTPPRAAPEKAKKSRGACALANARREARVQETGILDDRAKAAPGVVAAASLRWIPDNVAELPRLLLLEHGAAAAEPSWERILVDAGLDRESREMSPAERMLADRLAESRIRSPSLIYEDQMGTDRP